MVVGSDLCAEWLVQASWIMTFSSETVRTKISVLCPDPETVIGRLKAKCPGMVRAEHPAANEIKDVPIASFDSPDLEDTVRTLSSKEIICISQSQKEAMREILNWRSGSGSS